MTRNAAPAPRLPLPEPDVRPTFRRERRALKRGIAPVAGCDEAGRGPLAGPVVAAAVILDPRRIPKGLNDSKKLTAEQLKALKEGNLYVNVHSDRYKGGELRAQLQP